jgi:hypothetical protein
MPALVDHPVLDRLDPPTRDAVLICAAALGRLGDEEQRVAVSILMVAVKLGELRVVERTH